MWKCKKGFCFALAALLLLSLPGCGAGKAKAPAFPSVVELVEEGKEWAADFAAGLAGGEGEKKPSIDLSALTAEPLPGVTPMCSVEDLYATGIPLSELLLMKDTDPETGLPAAVHATPGFTIEPPIGPLKIGPYETYRTWFEFLDGKLTQINSHLYDVKESTALEEDLTLLYGAPQEVEIPPRGSLVSGTILRWRLPGEYPILVTLVTEELFFVPTNGPSYSSSSQKGAELHLSYEWWRSGDAA